MIEFLIFIGITLGMLMVRAHFDRKKIEQMKKDRAVNGDFRPENKNKMVCSILTGVPVSVRYGDGGLSPAGGQQIQWCNEILQDMGKRNSMMVKTMWGKQKMTREEVEKHLKNI